MKNSEIHYSKSSIKEIEIFTRVDLNNNESVRLSLEGLLGVELVGMNRYTINIRIGKMWDFKDDNILDDIKTLLHQYDLRFED